MFVCDTVNTLFTLVASNPHPVLNHAPCNVHGVIDVDLASLLACKSTNSIGKQIH